LKSVTPTNFSSARSILVALILWLVWPWCLADEVRSVARVDLQRYVGSWFEVARFPNWFQGTCVGDVIASYAALEDGTLKVTNRCRESQGRVNIIEGIATPASGDTTGARLKVSFVPGWLRWVPWVEGDYWVVMLDDDYRWAVVSEPSREYLWVLSRTPKLDPALYERIVNQLRRDGYDVDKLLPTLQTAGTP
jgi:apolipoprotein D and lipocalin family protein